MRMGLNVNVIRSVAYLVPFEEGKPLKMLFSGSKMETIFM